VSSTTTAHKLLGPEDGLRLNSGPGRDLTFKVTGEDTDGALDYFVVEVAPKDGPPLHVHHIQHETLHVVKGHFKVRLGDELFELDRGGFAYMPAGIPHQFLNTTDEPAELILTFTPGGGHKFFAELGPATREGMPEQPVVAAIFEKHDMTLLGPPLSVD
jgi:quercetin dioxygenase-like cupin family protein